MGGRYRLAVDIGGTFTDGVLLEEHSGRTWSAKSLTTPADPTDGFMTVTYRLAGLAGIELSQLSYVIHATTVATNAVIERTGANIGLVTTSGFRDILEIARQVRHELYNLQTDKPQPIVERRCSVEVEERLDYRGNVLLPLNEDDVVRAARLFAREKVAAVAVCLLHSYVNPDHERRVAAVLRRELPDVEVCLSSDVAPEIREYWRASTTVINAYLAPVSSRYIARLAERLSLAGCPTPVTLMQSSGGVMTAETACLRPVLLLESGPAAGVSAAAYFGTLAGFPDSIAFDMGGTTAKVGLVKGGEPTVLPEFEVGAGGWSGTTLVKGSGYPILAPVVDLVEVGAGGGSIAWVDTGGSLRVGPRSAGADPGPACYGRGGSEPTITDANVALGRLDPDYFLGGELRLDRAAAVAAIEALAARLKAGMTTTATGILAIADATMAEAMRLVSTHRGYDPRDSILVASGGAGPLHVVRLAADLGVPSVLVPPSPGVASAFGMLVSELRHDYRVTHQKPVSAIDVTEVKGVFEQFEADARDRLVREGTRPDLVTLTRGLEMRYTGQSWILPVAVPDDLFAAGDLGRLRTAFDTEHERVYGYRIPDDQVEIVNITLVATGSAAKPSLRPVAAGPPAADQAVKGTRPVFFDHRVEWVETPVYDRYLLLEGNRIAGPAVVEEVESTVLVHPGWVAEVRQFGALLITRAG